MEERRNGNTGITRITVKGFKSLAREVSVDLAPLTIFAGANSSGKSSVLQPLLLLKQTLEAGYDPGSLLMSGPNVNFTSASQFLTRLGTETAEQFDVAVSSGENGVGLVFKRVQRSGLEIVLTEYCFKSQTFTFRPEMPDKAIRDSLPLAFRGIHRVGSHWESEFREAEVEWTITRERCFLTPKLRYTSHSTENVFSPPFPVWNVDFISWFTDIIHLHGLRNIPERTYPVTAVEAVFPGLFQSYTASVIAQWQQDKGQDRLRMVGDDLQRLGLAWCVQARQIDDTQVELLVARLPRRSQSTDDYVSLADVGMGLSQVLPVVVALHAARPGQLVYLEQPEIHLHPRAQREFANVLADAVGRGVKIVVETHSSLLLLGIQTVVAEGTLKPEEVRLHWFQRDEEGITSVRSGTLDAAGAFGDWPEDFADVELESESRYLDAADHLRSKVH